MAQVELHPLCTLFPRMGGIEFDALKADISANGLRQPIVLLDGMILDGGNRYRACIDAGVKPVFTEYKGGNIVSFVLSANLHRRHMTPGQQAAIVASAQDWANAQTVGGNGANQHGKKEERCNVAPLLDTAASRAAESGASLRTQKMADKVAKASPELSKKVAHGEISLPKAVAKVEGKPEKPASKRVGKAEPVAAKGKPKKAEQTFESLLEENATLRDQVRTLQDNNRELASLLESYDSASEGEAAAAKALEKVKAQLRTVEATRDQWMTTAGELRREVKALRRKAGVEK